MDDSGDEDCTIYIEELKSDDPNLKMNAVTKVTTIASILGPARVCHELVPYLIEIIEEQDNEDEFLIKLAQEIFNLKDFVEEKRHVLVAPLEILSSMEEPVIREKAVECLTNLADNQPQKFFQQHFFQMVQQLGAWDNYPSRISACSLIPTLYPNIENEKQTQIWDLFQHLVSDDTPMVRRQCSAILSSLSQIEEIQSCEKKDQLIQIWQKLLDDKVDSVKIKAAESTPQLIKLIKDKTELEVSMKGFFKLSESKQKSWRVRYTVPEVFPQIAHYLSKEILKTQSIPSFEELLKDPEPEVRSIAVSTCHSLLSLLPSSGIQSFLTTFTNLASDQSLHVRLSLADQLCRIGALYQMDVLLSQLLPVVNQLFRDEGLDIKCKIVHNFPQLAQVLGPENSKKHLIPMIQSFQNEKQWRFKLEVVSIIPKLVKSAGWDCYLEIQDLVYEQAILNHYQAIRIQAIENLTQLIDQVGYEKIKSHIQNILKGLSGHINYVFRVAGLQALGILKTALPQNEVNSFFQEMAKKLIDDKVPNVRLNVYKCYSQVKDKLSQNVKNEFSSMAKQRSKDQDQDVAYYATNFQNI